MKTGPMAAMALGVLAGVHKNMHEWAAEESEENKRDIDSAQVYLEAAFWKLEQILERVPEAEARRVYCKLCDFYTDHVSTAHEGLKARGLLKPKVELCDDRGPRIGEDGTRCRQPKGHGPNLSHKTAIEDGFGDVRW